jgi:hypothetical protein
VVNAGFLSFPHYIKFLFGHCSAMIKKKHLTSPLLRTGIKHNPNNL